MVRRQRQTCQHRIHLHRNRHWMLHVLRFESASCELEVNEG